MSRGIESHVLDHLKLSPQSSDIKELRSLFNVAQKSGNQIAGKMYPRVRKLVASDEYQEILKEHEGESEKFVWMAMSKLASEYGVSKSEAEEIGSDIRNISQKCWAKKLNSAIMQKNAERIFNKIKKYLVGTSNELTFDSEGCVNSIENKAMGSGFDLKEDENADGTIDYSLVFKDALTKKKFCIPVFIRPNDKYARKILQNRKLNYVRVVRRTVKKKEVWYLQVIYDGLPPQKERKNERTDIIPQKKISVDLNVRNAAIVGSDGYADIIAFEETVDPALDRKIGNIQRKMERSRRVNNPHMYHADFEARKGEKTVTKKGKIKSKLEREKIVVVGNNPGRPVLKKDRFQNSKNYDRLAAEYKELNRIKSARTKNFHRSNINQLLDHGVTIVGEKLDGRGWSKLYGKSVNDTAQFFFYRELARKAKLAGGSFLDINTFQTALSQTHLDLSRQSKSLNERVHKDTSGREMHRDLFSAFMGLFVEEKKVEKTNKKGKKYKATEHYLNPEIDLAEQFDVLSPGMDKAWDVWEDKNKDLWSKVRPKARKQSRRMIRRNIRKRKNLNQLENLRLDIPEQGVDKS